MKQIFSLITLIGLSFGMKAQDQTINGTTFKINGNVGVGTINPLAKLHIEGRMLLNQGVIQRGGTPITNTTDLGLYSHLSGNWIRIVSNNAPIRFFTDIGNDGTGSNARMTIESNGNVGIGTSTPSSQLELYGGGNLLIKGASDDAGDLIFQTNTSRQLARIWSIGYGGASGLNLSSGDNIPDLTISTSGNVGIGTTNPGTWKLAVNGNIRAKEIKVETGWSDFVFENNYLLPTLIEVETHIKEKGHLKDIPSAQEVAKNGINLGEMDSKLLMKIEELTLYTIQQENKINEQAKKIEDLESLNKKFLELQTRLENLEAEN